MGFSDLELRYMYRSATSDIAEDFMVPVLSRSIEYKRAVGFFSSTALIEVSVGIAEIVIKGGKIKFIVSPILSEEDILAITQGYEDRERIIEKALLNNVFEHYDPRELDRLNLLSNLIADNILDIKVAYLDDGKNIGMYHEKIGVMKDEYGNIIAFTGSLNESANALLNNFESIHVFSSREESQRAKEIDLAFTEMWENKTNKIKVIDFPLVLRDKLLSYKTSDIDYSNISDYFYKSPNSSNFNNEPVYDDPKPQIPDYIILHDYQELAIENWFSQNKQGIFDMATGTGKTITALAATVRLLEELDYKLAVVVVCPYIHLVDQWVEEARNFNINPIVGHSQSDMKNWKIAFRSSINDYKFGISGNFFLFTTISTFRSDEVQSQLKRLKGNALIIVDEAHNFGTENLRKTLLDNFTYRIGLSATIERYRDDEGTQTLIDYFGDKCIQYDIDRAINEGKLTKYKYFPVVVTLTEDELYEYDKLTKELGRCIIKNKNGKVSLTKSGEMIAIERARIVAGAMNKIDALVTEIAPFKNEHNMLVYCGTAKIIDDNNDEVRQIMKVCDVLGNNLAIKVDKYTSEENINERRKIKKRFENGDDLQAVIAIKCLDEGVDIPGIKRAFILASSTNPREYIQRRGRVLRLHKGKKYAYIHDFITMPFPIENANLYSIEELKSYHSLINNEINRMKEFSRISENPADSDKLIFEITEAFKLNLYDVDSVIDIEWSDDFE